MNGSNHSGHEFRDHLPSYLISIRPGGRAIYILSLLLVSILLACLPLISVQVSVSGRGIIRSIQDRTTIKATCTGIVSGIYVSEGDCIKKSEPLIQIRSIETKENLKILYQELQEEQNCLEDLRGLTLDLPEVPLTPKYYSEYQEYLMRIDYLELMHKKAERERTRHDRLYREGLISEKEYDDLVFAAEKAGKELENYKYQSLKNWQNGFYQQSARLRELQLQIRNAEERIRLTTVFSPASGSLVEFQGIFEGSAIQSGSVIGILSPDSGMIGEFYVSSRNIAFLGKGQKVHLQMDAFSAREWGVIPGWIYDISNDFILLENQPVYRVRCQIEKNELCLRNGHTAELKKGMTFQAQCLVARRTLFQLLADKTENWLNPSLQRDKITLLP